MTQEPTKGHLARLESEIQKNPASEHLREQLLFALAADSEWSNDPRRLEQIEWFLEHNPGHSICATPLMRVDPASAPDAYARLKSRWLALVAAAPGDSTLVRGAAAFVAAESVEEGRRLLRAALTVKPVDPKLWLDLGRMSEDPRERLLAFERARELGETRTNLLVWIAQASFNAGEYVKAKDAVAELLVLVDEARARFGDRLDWSERGAELWKRARQASATDDAARTITDAVTDHAYRKHFAFTVLGLLADQQGDVDQAVRALRTSAESQNDFRLSSYGPSLDLVKAVCARGRWEDALRYLQSWERTWDSPRLRTWIAAAKERRIPDFDSDPL